MKRLLIVGALAATALWGCEEVVDPPSNSDAGTQVDAGTQPDAGETTDAGEDTDAGTDAGTQAPELKTATDITTYLDGKTLTMEGDNIPTWPNGFNENVNFGPSSQCYNKTAIAISGGVWHVSSTLGTIDNAPTIGDVGQCDRTTTNGTAAFDSTNVLVENVQGNGSCFDIDVTYNGFKQEGRGQFSEDGSSVTLELFFGGQASGHRCLDGEVGAPTVKLTQGATTFDFTGDAKQVYVITQTE